MPAPYNIFISYSHNDHDRPLLRELRNHLAPLVNKGRIRVWDDTDSLAGDEWMQQIEGELATADCVLLLASSNYNASKFINDTELPLILERHSAGKCRVVPILLRPFYFKLTDYAHFEFLPKNPDNEELTPVDSWTQQDRAFEVIVERLVELFETPPPPPQSSSAAADVWATFFEKYPLKADLGELMAVDCDRDKHYQYGVFDHFLRRKNDPCNLVYWLSACPHQRPASLAKRLVYDLQANGLQLAYPQEPSDNSLTVLDLKFSLSREQTFAQFWQMVQDRLHVPNAANPEALATSSHHHQQDRIVLALRVQENDWRPDLIGQLGYLLSRFRCVDPAARKYLLFFVFEFGKAHLEQHRERSAQYRDELQRTARNFNEDGDDLAVGYYELLPPVLWEDVEAWYRKVAAQWPDKAQLKELKTTLLSQLAEEDRHRPDFDLEDVEKMQAAAWQFFNRPNFSD